MNTAIKQSQWVDVCALDDLVVGSGVCALVQGQQVAIFYLPDETPAVYAIGNWDPIGEANVMSRGVVGDIGGRLVVASPLYKQHFDLTNGECLEDEEKPVPSYAVKLDQNRVWLQV